MQMSCSADILSSSEVPLALHGRFTNTWLKCMHLSLAIQQLKFMARINRPYWIHAPGGMTLLVRPGLYLGLFDMKIDRIYKSSCYS